MAPLGKGVKKKCWFFEKHSPSIAIPPIVAIPQLDE